MDSTPKRPRRVLRESLTEAPVQRPGGSRRVKPLEDDDTLPNKDAAAKGQGSLGSLEMEGPYNDVPPPSPALPSTLSPELAPEFPLTPFCLGGSIGPLSPVREEESPVQPGKATETSGVLEHLLVTYTDGALEFEFGGQIYRVSDAAAFAEAVEAGAVAAKEAKVAEAGSGEAAAQAGGNKTRPRRSLADLRRAQRLAWAAKHAQAPAGAPTAAAAASDKHIEAVEGAPAWVTMAVDAGRVDPALSRAWRAAKE